MLILVVGMPKSGSSWYYNLTNDALVAAGYQDSRAIRDKYGLHDILKFDVCNIQQLTIEKLQRVTTPPLSLETLVVKTHDKPNDYVKKLMATGMVKATYIFRDLRGVALSGFEEGQNLRSQGRFHRTVCHLTSLEDAIYWSKKHIGVWREWANLKDVLLMRYEDLTSNPFHELSRVRTHLGIDVSDAGIQQIIRKWKAWKTEQLSYARFGEKRDLHFNKAITGRFRKVMTQKQLDLCQRVLGEYLQEMGYAA